ncbi:MAG: S1 family peptidase [Treponema sp.]
MKKFFFCLILTNLFSLYAQIRNYVGIVRTEYNSETVSFLKDAQSELKAKGYSSYADYIDDYLQGRFGSGFVYVNPQGKNFVITNRHVIDYGTSASIEFEDPKTGAVTKYANLLVKAIDDEIDIAVLQFEGNKSPFKKGLIFSSVSVEDGTDVYSAGFPGLGNTPLWQLGKGIVTNSSARIKELLNPEISSLIQHSAEVDGGNSGGPLLIASKTAEAGYEVVGINTWKATYRQNTNFAIPAKVIRDYIANGKSATQEEKDIKLDKALSKTEADYSEIAKFISIEKVYESGSDAFIDVLKFAPNKVREEAINAYSNSPIDGMKYAIAYDLKNNIKPKHEKTKDNTSKKNSEIIKFMGLESPSRLDLNAGINIGFGDYIMGFGMDAGFSVWPFTWCGIGASYIHFFKDGLNVIGFGPAVRIPLNFNKFCISPCGKAEVGLTVQGENKYTQLKLQGGMEVLFNHEDKYKYGFGISYVLLKFNKFGGFSGSDDFVDKDISDIAVYGKFCL